MFAEGVSVALVLVVFGSCSTAGIVVSAEDGKEDSKEATCRKADNAAVFGDPLALYNPKSPFLLLSCQLNSNIGPVQLQAFA